MTEYIFVRHAECKKNLAGITGGEGAGLTERGAVQANLLASDLAAQTSAPRILACPTMQTIETAEIIAATLRRPLSVDDRLTPAGMGVVGGLTAVEMETRYPEYAHLLARWRNLEIEAHELKIPQIEPPMEFWTRTIATLTSYQESRQIIVVATRSLMVWAVNVSMGHHPRPGGGYKHHDIRHCQTVRVSL